ncbi:hypothetical protein FPC831_1370002 [Flavobacterium psychrophilum]|nr:hypothetical protein DK150_640072 [Flavobacterium psychrophilum]SNB00833.1 hypothetical protein FPC831_1370002 [Flavobacterium psychrophilum]SNB37089.1 hypothetical protein NO098_340031 [Flavobacterium psychrophilum]
MLYKCINVKLYCEYMNNIKRYKIKSIKCYKNRLNALKRTKIKNVLIPRK